MEYCFTSEGSDKQPQASSLRGLDAATYYRYNGVLNCGHAVVRHLIMDSLHHWAEEYEVDGFCFVNAETLVQGQSLAFSLGLLHSQPYVCRCRAVVSHIILLVPCRECLHLLDAGCTNVLQAADACTVHIGHKAN